MDALECIATRRSIRRFIEQPVDQETVMTVIEAGSLAPSSGNVQDWRFILVDDADLKKKISEHSLGQECVHNAAFLVVVCSDPEQTERHYGLRGVRLYTVQNCAAAIQNMLLAAHAMGLGGVWVGAFDEEKLRVLLHIPNNVRPQAILAFGYPAEKPDSKIVKDLAIITYFNAYGSKFRNLHRVLRDFSVDWERMIKRSHTAMGKLKEKAQQSAAETKEKLTKEDGIIPRYKEKISQKLEKFKPQKR